ncbi:MAG TPA: class IV adenylate cyclase [Anaerolineales bacterium]
MAAGGRETEAKFYVHDLERVKSRLEELGASLVQERVLETNVRFDLPDARLRAEGRVLRLRRDTEAWLTYKSASKKEQGVQSREEIEFVVESFEKARQFLEALGYQKLVYYEKYRTTYGIQPSEESIHVMLDELPYGNFVEIEGETIESIRDIAGQLGLRWESAIATSYHALFEHVKKTLNRPFEDLSFAEFKGSKVDVSHLDVEAADE